MSMVLPHQHQLRPRASGKVAADVLGDAAEMNRRSTAVPETSDHVCYLARSACYMQHNTGDGRSRLRESIHEGHTAAILCAYGIRLLDHPPPGLVRLDPFPVVADAEPRTGRHRIAAVGADVLGLLADSRRRRSAACGLPITGAHKASS